MQIEKLYRCRDLRLQVRSLDDKLEVLHAAVERSTGRLTGVPRGSEWYDPMPEYADEAAKLGRLYAKEALELLHLVLEVSFYLEKLPYTYERIMRLRYVDGLQYWSDVAEAAHLSEDRCRAINSQALRILKNMA
ncbi:MAG: hypothetical protein EOM66_03130 [Clostridia bacterium]|nr:hypothetical protein [Clostridia bacterium]